MRRNFDKVYPNEAPLNLLVARKAFRGDSLRYKDYLDCHTVGDAVEKGYSKARIDQDVQRGNIKVGD